MQLGRVLELRGIFSGSADGRRCDEEEPGALSPFDDHTT
jgi:hypothetical protein